MLRSCLLPLSLRPLPTPNSQHVTRAGTASSRRAPTPFARLLFTRAVHQLHEARPTHIAPFPPARGVVGAEAAAVSEGRGHGRYSPPGFLSVNIPSRSTGTKAESARVSSIAPSISPAGQPCTGEFASTPQPLRSSGPSISRKITADLDSGFFGRNLMGASTGGAGLP